MVLWASKTSLADFEQTNWALSMIMFCKSRLLEVAATPLTAPENSFKALAVCLAALLVYSSFPSDEAVKSWTTASPTLLLVVLRSKAADWGVSPIKHNPRGSNQTLKK